MFQELVPPNIPAVNSYFDVNVTLAASPSNFTVQSWVDGTELESLQQDMVRFYNNAKNRRPVTKQDLELVSLNCDKLLLKSTLLQM